MVTVCYFHLLKTELQIDVEIENTVNWKFVCNSLRYMGTMSRVLLCAWNSIDWVSLRFRNITHVTISTLRNPSHIRNRHGSGTWVSHECNDTRLIPDNGIRPTVKHHRKIWRVHVQSAALRKPRSGWPSKFSWNSPNYRILETILCPLYFWLDASIPHVQKNFTSFNCTSARVNILSNNGVVIGLRVHQSTCKSIRSKL